MMRGLLAAIGATGLAVSLLAGGCGESASDALALKRSSMSKPAFARRVDRVCAAQNKVASRRIRKAYGMAKVRGASNEQDAIDLEVRIYVPILIDEAEAVSRRVRVLGAPDGLEADVLALLDAYGEWIEKARATPLKVVIANDVYNDARDLGREYGLPSCATSPFEVEA